MSLLNIALLFAQKSSKIEVEYSDFADVNQVEPSHSWAKELFF